jgi:hypothetical protein
MVQLIPVEAFDLIKQWCGIWGRDADALRLLKVEGLGVAEIAQVLEVTEDQAAGHIAAAMAAIEARPFPTGQVAYYRQLLGAMRGPKQGSPKSPTYSRSKYTGAYEVSVLRGAVLTAEDLAWPDWRTAHDYDPRPIREWRPCGEQVG